MLTSILVLVPLKFHSWLYLNFILGIFVP